MIIFPQRTSRIKTYNRGSFTVGNRLMYSARLEMENGDNISLFSYDNFTFNEGSKITYQMTKKDDKTKTKLISGGKPLIPLLDEIPITSLLFFDIETVRTEKDLKKGTPLYNSWLYKMRNEKATIPAKEKLYLDDAPLFPEYGKIACITIGMIKQDGLAYLKSYSGTEEEILESFLDVLDKCNPKIRLCGFVSNKFDIPFVVRRLLVNRIRVPDFLDVFDVKPWELGKRFIDIHDLWRNLGYHGSSLLGVATALGLPSPKSKLDGSKVSDAFYAGEIEEIVEYCELDVLTTINIARHLYDQPPLEDFIKN